MGMRERKLICRRGHTRARALRDGQEANWGSGGPSWSWNQLGGIYKVPAPSPVGRPFVPGLEKEGRLEEEGQQLLGQETEERVRCMAR